MLYSEKITLINTDDRVLEIGPGSTPHPRSDDFLELHYDTNQERISQRGGESKEANFGRRPVYYDDGGRFPFADSQFDYVICSQIIEHVDEPASFLGETFGVGTERGYLEYPLITYEYLYDFDVHLHFVKFDFEQGILRYLPKNDAVFHQFAPVNSLFYKTLECGWDDLCAANKTLFFEGVEFSQPFSVEKTNELEKLRPSASLIFPKGAMRGFVDRVINKLEL